MFVVGYLYYLYVYMICIYIVNGIPTPLKNDGVKVSWDDEIPNMMGKIKFMFQTTKQT